MHWAWRTFSHGSGRTASSQSKLRADHWPIYRRLRRERASWRGGHTSCAEGAKRTHSKSSSQRSGFVLRFPYSSRYRRWHRSWCGRTNPASGKPIDRELRHGMMGRDLPPRARQRDGFRRRVPYAVPKRIESEDFQKLIDAASSFRDKAILTLLCRTGQRIGDWNESAEGMAFWGCRCRMSTASEA